MDPLAHQIAECCIDHPLSLDAAFGGKGGALDAQAEVALARGIVPAMTAVLLAVVDQIDPCR